MARRSGEVQSLSAQVVYNNDFFELQYGLDEKLNHVPAEGDRGEVKGAYVVFRYKDGSHSFDYMPKEDIDKIRAISQAKDSGPWVDHYGEMAKKTVIRRHVKIAPLSVELARAAEAENLSLAGKSQMELFLPQEAPVAIEDSTHTAGEFDRLAAEHLDLPDPTFDKYLKEIAGAQTPVMTVEQFKAEGVAQFDELWDHFEIWRKLGPPEKKKKKAPEMIDYGGPWDQSKWWRKREGDGVKTGFGEFVYANIDTFPDAPDKVQGLAIDKWADFYKDKPFPTPGAKTGQPTGKTKLTELEEAKGAYGEDVYEQARDSFFKDGVEPDGVNQERMVVAKMTQIADEEKTEGGG